MSARRALWTLIAVSAALRIAAAAPLGPGNDEAYYSLFAVHPSWSYFDHPPMLAAVEAVGLALLPHSTLALRLGFILLFAASTVLAYRIAGRLAGPAAGLAAALALNLAGYFGLAAATFALPDGPLLFFWLLTLDRLDLARRRPDSLARWAAVGLAWAGALLSKYHAVFLPAGALLFAVLDRDARTWFRRPGPYLALALGLAGFSPVLAWNAQHGWASFAFQGGRALAAGKLRPLGPAVMLAEQAAYLFPWVWLACLAVLGSGLRRLADPAYPSARRLLLCLAVVPLGAFGMVACFQRVLPHWSLVAYLPLVVLVGERWSGRWERDRVGMSWRLGLAGAIPVAVLAAAVGQARWGMVQRGGVHRPGLLAVGSDPTLDLYGWDQVATALERRGLLQTPHTFLFTGHWHESGQLAFATRFRIPVLCYHGGDARGFADWSDPDDWVGKDGILVAVGSRSTVPACFERWFTRIEPLGGFAVVRAGAPVRMVRLFRCVRQTRPFPFDRAGARTLPTRPVHPQLDVRRGPARRGDGAFT